MPQNIDLEDRIVGPLTMVQFMYLLGGGLLVYILFQTLAPRSMAAFLILGIPIGLATLAMTFLKIQEQPFMHFLVAGFAFLSSPKTRIWKRITPPAPIIVDKPVKVTEKTETTKKRLNKSELDQLAYMLDTRFSENQQKQKNFGMVTQVYEELIKENKTPAQEKPQNIKSQKENAK